MLCLKYAMSDVALRHRVYGRTEEVVPMQGAPILQRGTIIFRRLILFDDYGVLRKRLNQTNK